MINCLLYTQQNKQYISPENVDRSVERALNSWSLIGWQQPGSLIGPHFKMVNSKARSSETHSLYAYVCYVTSTFRSNQRSKACFNSYIAPWRKPLRNLELRILPKWGSWIFSSPSYFRWKIFGCNLLCSFTFNLNLGTSWLQSSAAVE